MQTKLIYRCWICQHTGLSETHEQHKGERTWRMAREKNKIAINPHTDVATAHTNKTNYTKRTHTERTHLPLALISHLPLYCHCIRICRIKHKSQGKEKREEGRGGPRHDQRDSHSPIRSHTTQLRQNQKSERSCQCEKKDKKKGEGVKRTWRNRLLRSLSQRPCTARTPHTSGYRSLSHASEELSQ